MTFNYKLPWRTPFLVLFSFSCVRWFPKLIISLWRADTMYAFKKNISSVALLSIWLCTEIVCQYNGMNSVGVEKTTEFGFCDSHRLHSLFWHVHVLYDFALFRAWCHILPHSFINSFSKSCWYRTLSINFSKPCSSISYLFLIAVM